MKAVAVLTGKDISGIVRFEQESADSVTKITANFTNIPQGSHGFHIHEFGDTTDGCTSAGAHFNPFGKRHGGPSQDPSQIDPPYSNERHVGDMGNIISDGSEHTSFELVDSLITLHGENCVVGRSCVLHRDEDDLGKGTYEDSPTTGHSGPRIACGIIGWTQ